MLPAMLTKDSVYSFLPTKFWFLREADRDSGDGGDRERGWEKERKKKERDE